MTVMKHSNPTTEDYGVVIITLSSAFCTLASELVSRALVASSSNRIRGLRTSARAIAMRCF